MSDLINFFDYEPDLDYFAAHVLPLWNKPGYESKSRYHC